MEVYTKRVVRERQEMDHKERAILKPGFPVRKGHFGGFKQQLIVLFVCAVPGIEPRAIRVLGRSCLTNLHPHSSFQHLKQKAVREKTEAGKLLHRHRSLYSNIQLQSSPTSLIAYYS
jgi:hypothetical protein